MSGRIVATALLGISLCLLGSTASRVTVESVEPVASPWVAQTVDFDTLNVSVVAGETFIRTLPEATDGSVVDSYRMLRGPALSGVAGRSLTWITRDIAPGTYTIRLQARRPEASPDTLVVRVQVQSP